MIYRIFPTKDTWITSFRKLNTPQTASNLGRCEILRLFKKSAVTSSLSPGLGRILMKFPLDEITSLTGSEVVNGAVSYHLRLYDAQHDQTLPSSFSVQIQAVTQDWDEGRGHDADGLRDYGFANWDKAKSNVWWTVAGASGSGPIVTASFDQGDENLLVEVTPIVNAWLTGGLANNGFLIHLSGTHETDSNDYYVKMFHSRETSFRDKMPKLEARWNSVVQTGSIAQTTGSGPFYVNVTNMKPSYEPDEVVNFRLYVRPVDFNPAVVLTASSDSRGVVVDKAYWRLTNDRTDEVVVPFGTGSDLSTKLSYDSLGNYFKFHMRSLPQKEVYRLAFIFEVSGTKTLVDEGFKFRVD